MYVEFRIQAALRFVGEDVIGMTSASERVL